MNRKVNDDNENSYHTVLRHSFYTLMCFSITPLLNIVRI